MTDDVIETDDTGAPSTEIAIPDEKRIALAFADPVKMDELLAELTVRANTFEYPDLALVKNRKAVRSFAYVFRQSKKAIEGVGDKRTEDAKAFIKSVATVKKRAADHIDHLVQKIIDPVVLWEQAEEDRRGAIRARLEQFRVDEFGPETESGKIAAKLAEFELVTLDGEDWQEFLDDARHDLSVALIHLKRILEMSLTREENERQAAAEREELARLRKEAQEAREKAEREVAEARAKAEREAAEAAERERAAEAARQAEIARIQREAEEKAQAAIEAARKEAEEKAAEERREREKQEAAEAEKREQERAELAEARRRAAEAEAKLQPEGEVEPEPDPAEMVTAPKNLADQADDIFPDLPEGLEPTPIRPMPPAPREITRPSEHHALSRSSLVSAVDDAMRHHADEKEIRAYAEAAVDEFLDRLRIAERAIYREAAE